MLLKDYNIETLQDWVNKQIKLVCIKTSNGTVTIFFGEAHSFTCYKNGYYVLELKKWYFDRDTIEVFPLEFVFPLSELISDSTMQKEFIHAITAEAREKMLKEI